MISPVSPVRSVFHLFAIALLMAGVVMKPMLASICEIHSVGHLVDVSAGPARAGGHQHESDLIEQDHGSGSHLLLHEGNFVGAYADLVKVISVPALSYGRVLPPVAVVQPIALRHLEGPFRPPIG